MSTIIPCVCIPFWTKEEFVEEIENLREYISLIVLHTGKQIYWTSIYQQHIIVDFYITGYTLAGKWFYQDIQIVNTSNLRYQCNCVKVWLEIVVKSLASFVEPPLTTFGLHDHQLILPYLDTEWFELGTSGIIKQEGDAS